MKYHLQDSLLISYILDLYTCIFKVEVLPTCSPVWNIFGAFGNMYIQRMDIVPKIKLTVQNHQIPPTSCLVNGLLTIITNATSKQVGQGRTITKKNHEE